MDVIGSRVEETDRQREGDEVTANQCRVLRG
jgi:hypothetical protein